MTISARNVSVNFSGLKALDNVDLDISVGKVHALIGPNGAGKTTLLNVLSGFIQPNKGSISFNGKEIGGEPAHLRARLGIARSFQTPRFIPHATIRENILVGFYPHVRSNVVVTLLGLPNYFQEERKLGKRVDEIIDLFDLGDVAEDLASDVPLWRLRVMEIARCLAVEPDFIFLDEPAAGSDEHERRLLAEHIEKLRASEVGVLLVEHNFGFIKQVSGFVTVLAQGRLLAAGAPEQIETHPDVVEMYLGGEES